jgi:hypothetical protein
MQQHMSLEDSCLHELTLLIHNAQYSDNTAIAKNDNSALLIPKLTMELVPGHLSSSFHAENFYP